MNEGQIVKCISADFPMIATTEESKDAIGTMPTDHPTVGNYYRITEVLGDFISLSYFSDHQWWHKSRFRLATLDELETVGLMNIAQEIERRIAK